MDYRFVTHAEVPRLAEQLTALSNTAFAEYEGAPEVDEAFTAWYLERPGSSADVCVAALYGDQMVANVLVALQELNLGGEYVLCGLIDTVATDPAHRQHGLARQLMEMAHQIIRERGAEAAVLYTNPANHPYWFYGRLGYFVRAQAGMLAGTRPAAANHYRVRPMAETETEAVRALINGQYTEYEGFCHVDEPLWRWHRQQRPATMPAQVVVAEAEGQVVGTAALAEVDVLLGGVRQRVTVVSDAVYPDADCLRDLLAQAAQPQMLSLQSLEAPELADLEAVGFQTSVGEVSMVLPLGERVLQLLHTAQRPWYVMVESVVGV